MADLSNIVLVQKNDRVAGQTEHDVSSGEGIFLKRWLQKQVQLGVAVTSQKARWRWPSDKTKQSRPFQNSELELVD
ncbi:hypothetical protein sync_0575 [Synechococcus sp. CC9311]|nr:hypothetical protein sync_0575 [Synechococcus sp. CC9311]